MSYQFKIGSLFDGSGGFPLAGSLCGVDPVWAAEVEPYPIAVTRSRFDGSGSSPLLAFAKKMFPNLKLYMKHQGDISKINGAEVEPVDVITFGSPCQDLSVAGKRAGLKHEANGDEETTRSGLFMEAVRIIKEMREATHGKYPSFALWENVPGAFSSNKGEDFRVVLEELIKIVEPSAQVPAPDKNGWPYADCYVGDGWSLAYRVFDAQFWGVPQRRRRIHLVLDLRGECAEKVLFEREGLRGYFAEGRTPWQGTAGDAQDRSGAADREGEIAGGPGGRGLNAVGFDAYNQALTGDLSMTVTCSASDAHHVPCVLMDAYQHHGWRQNDKCGTLTAGQNDGIRGDTPLVCQPVAYSFDSLASNSMKSKNPHSGCRQVEVAKCIDTTDPNPSKNQGGIAVVEAKPVYCLQGNGIDRADTAGCNGKGWKEDACYTLNTIDRPAVVYAIDQQGGKGGANYAKDVMPTICSDSHGTPHAVAYSIGNGQLNQISMSEVCNTLDCMHDKQAVLVGEAHGIDCRNMNEYEELYPTLQAKPNGGQSLNFSGAVRVRYIVRRLTPTECARLQGFADRWGDIDPKSDFSDAEYSFWMEVRNTHARINGKAEKEYTKAQMLTWYNKLLTDSAEYKMWGNGIALPPALYCMQGIVDALSAYEEVREA